MSAKVTFELSSNDDEYGIVTTGEMKVKVLFSNVPSIGVPSITIIHGVGSIYKYFVFIPVDLYEALLTVHSDELFVSSLIALCTKFDEASDD